MFSISIRVQDFETPEVSAHPGAYIEVWERNGRIVGRTHFFDSDIPRSAEQLKIFHRALGKAIERMEKESAKRELPPLDVKGTPPTLEMLKSMLGLVMVPEYMPPDSVLEKLTETEREEMAEWCGDCHFEASDNEVIAGPMPPCLRDQLPADHFYKNWRVK